MRLVKNSERIFVMLFVLSVLDLIGKVSKKNGSFWEISPKSVYLPTHPRVFVRFGRTKGEIWVKKGDFPSDLVFF